MGLCYDDVIVTVTVTDFVPTGLSYDDVIVTVTVTDISSLRDFAMMM